MDDLPITTRLRTGATSCHNNALALESHAGSAVARLKHASHQLEEASALITELVEALEPFVRELAGVYYGSPDESPLEEINSLRVGHLRNAAAVLAKAKE